MLFKSNKLAKGLANYSFQLGLRLYSIQCNPIKNANTPKGNADIINATFLCKTIGSSWKIWSNLLEQNPNFKNAKRSEFVDSINMLKSMDITLEDIVKRPRVLNYKSSTLLNRYTVLKECGFTTITPSLLFRFVTIVNKQIAQLKSQKFLEGDIVTRLKGCFTDVNFEIPVADYDNMTLSVLREIIIHAYFRQRFQISDETAEKTLNAYRHLRHRNFKGIQQVVDFLMEELHFSQERILKNVFLLHADIENLRNIVIHMPNIGDRDIRRVLYEYPKIMMSNSESLVKTLQHIRDFGFNDDAILSCLSVLTLSPETVLNRLRCINEFDGLDTNPRALRLVHFQNKARARLKQLHSMNINYISLHILTCASSDFEKFISGGGDRSNGQDLITYLMSVFGKTNLDVRSKLARHSYWYCTPLSQMKATFDFLRNEKFSLESIFENIHLLLYPVTRIEEKLTSVLKPEFVEGLKEDTGCSCDLTDSEVLALILYLIEVEFHFTGTGLFNEPHSLSNSNALHVDVPEGPAHLLCGQKI